MVFLFKYAIYVAKSLLFIEFLHWQDLRKILYLSHSWQNFCFLLKEVIFMCRTKKIKWLFHAPTKKDVFINLYYFSEKYFLEVFDFGQNLLPFSHFLCFISINSSYFVIYGQISKPNLYMTFSRVLETTLYLRIKKHHIKFFNLLRNITIQYNFTDQIYIQKFNYNARHLVESQIM